MKFLILICLISLSCKRTDSNLGFQNDQNKKSNDDDLIVCTLMAGISDLQIKITSEESLPANLGFSLDDDKIDIEECRESESIPRRRFNFRNNRKTVIIDIPMILSSEDHYIYFTDGWDPEPKKDFFDGKLFSKDTCQGQYSEIKTFSNIKIEWFPGYANGEHCGITHFSGKSEVNYD